MVNISKKLLLLLSITTLALSQAALIYKEIPASAYSRDPLIPITRDYGINAVVNNAITSKKVANTTFSILKISYIYNATNSTYVNYRYDLSLKNKNGDIIGTNFTVQYIFSSKRTLVIALGYNVTYGSGSTNPTPVTFKEIPRSAYQSNPLIAITQNFGVAAVVQNAISTKRVANSTFTVQIINHIYNATDGKYFDYKFDLSLNNSAGDIIKTNFTVQYQSDTKKNIILAQSYKVTYGPNSTAPANSTNSTTPTNNNATNTTSSAPFTQVPESNFNDTLLQSLANYGVQYVATQNIAQNKLPAGQYNLTDIYSINQQVLASNITNYKYNVEFAKDDGSRVAETNFTIRYVSSSGNTTITAYSLTVLPYGA